MGVSPIPPAGSFRNLSISSLPHHLRPLRRHLRCHFKYVLIAPLPINGSQAAARRHVEAAEICGFHRCLRLREQNARILL